jgi:hypothetical protein
MESHDASEAAGSGEDAGAGDALPCSPSLSSEDTAVPSRYSLIIHTLYTSSSSVAQVSLVFSSRGKAIMALRPIRALGRLALGAVARGAAAAPPPVFYTRAIGRSEPPADAPRCRWSCRSAGGAAAQLRGPASRLGPAGHWGRAMSSYENSTLYQKIRMTPG